LALKYQSGDGIMAGDQVRYHGELGEIEFVVEPGANHPQTDWYLEELGPGVMIAEPKVFGHVYVTDTDTDASLVLVARRGGTNRTG
jgi:hypothetical protein